jgi:transcriptional regulator with XRE-family HTH domain
MDNIAKPGPILRSIRLQRGWKLADVAEKTGYPVSTLSRMETGKVALTYEKIARLSEAMEVDIGVFFADLSPPAAIGLATGRRSVVHPDSGRVIKAPGYQNRVLATDLLNKRFIPIITEIYARSIEEFGELHRHSGEEFTYVLEGILEIHTELYVPVRLEAGEGLYFDSGIAHGYCAVGKERCRTLTICAGEESQLVTALERKLAPARAPVVSAVKRFPKRRVASK